MLARRSKRHLCIDLAADRRTYKRLDITGIVSIGRRTNPVDALTRAGWGKVTLILQKYWKGMIRERWIQSSTF